MKTGIFLLLMLVAGLPQAEALTVLLNWVASTTPTVTAYNVYRATSTTGPFTMMTQVTGTTWTDKNVITGTTYTYQVTAVAPPGESAPSAPATVTVKVKKKRWPGALFNLLR